jgi:mannose-1-phosphate guanylyltransferase
LKPLRKITALKPKYAAFLAEKKRLYSGYCAAQRTCVKEFKEKPDAATAEEYIAQGALWNAGVSSFKLGYLLNDVSGKKTYLMEEILIQSNG